MDKSKNKRVRRSSKNESVQVVVRCRPMNEKEKQAYDVRVVDVWPSRGVIEICNPKEKDTKENKKTFTYDGVYDWFATQQNIYDETVLPLVSSVLEGFNGCIFAYGQTGTGKTHTMEGDLTNEEQYGIIPKAFQQIWNHINRTTNTQFLVTVSYLEIYMETIRDLLKIKHKKTLEVRELDGQGVHVPNLHTVNCKSAEEMMKVMITGNKNRTTGFTNMNEHSSRSHAIFQISIEMCNTDTNTMQVGKLNLIDLAGSERQSKTGAIADRLKEASKINKALSSLGNVISALAENSPHIPYRDSKLTRLLQDSLGGNSKTIMIANIGPASSNYEETLTTLRYAHRAKAITNKPMKNEDPKDAKLREYQQEIARLKTLIAERQKNEASYMLSINNVSSTDDGNSETETESESEDEGSKVEGKVKEKEIEKQLELEKLKTEELAKKLKNLEKQLVRGGKNILDTVNERQMQIEQQMMEIAARKKREREMQQQLELEEETTTELRETFTNLQQEVEYKTIKLNKLHSRWQALKQEVKDVKEENQRERRELEAIQDDLVQQLKLKCMIMDNFVPMDVRTKLLGQVQFDENLDDWVLPKKSIEQNELLRQIAKPGRRYPISDLAEEHLLNGPVRYKHDNVLDLNLDMPKTIVTKYKPPSTPPHFCAMVQSHFDEEEDSNRIEVHEPPPSFQPRMFPHRDLLRRFERNARSVMDFALDMYVQFIDFYKITQPFKSYIYSVVHAFHHRSSILIT